MIPSTLNKQISLLSVSSFEIARRAAEVLIEKHAAYLLDRLGTYEVPSPVLSQEDIVMIAGRLLADERRQLLDIVYVLANRTAPR